MKNSIVRNAKEPQTLNGNPALSFTGGYSKRFRTPSEYNPGYASFSNQGLLTPDAKYQITNGLIPDLRDICQALAGTFTTSDAPYSARQFLPVVQNLHTLEAEEEDRFLKNRETRHVLVSNELFEVVLIHWKPGKVSDIHGHPGGGCLFSVLKGKLEELRFSPEKSPQLISSATYRKGSMAYIDDSLAYHQVGNPHGSSAISLHIYLK